MEPVTLLPSSSTISFSASASSSVTSTTTITSATYPDVDTRNSFLQCSDEHRQSTRWNHAIDVRPLPAVRGRAPERLPAAVLVASSERLVQLRQKAPILVHVLVKAPDRRREVVQGTPRLCRSRSIQGLDHDRRDDRGNHGHDRQRHDQLDESESVAPPTITSDRSPPIA